MLTFQNEKQINIIEQSKKSCNKVFSKYTNYANAQMGHVTINHNSNNYPVKVDVQVKITDGGNDYIFTGTGPAHRDDDTDAYYGGVIYIYNNVDIKLMYQSLSIAPM